LRSFKNLTTDSGKRLCFILCYDYDDASQITHHIHLFSIDISYSDQIYNNKEIKIEQIKIDKFFMVPTHHIIKKNSISQVTLQQR
jgi:hypothetical protein